jgi:hypothetical protein
MSEKFLSDLEIKDLSIFEKDYKAITLNLTNLKLKQQIQDMEVKIAEQAILIYKMQKDKLVTEIDSLRIQANGARDERKKFMEGLREKYELPETGWGYNPESGQIITKDEGEENE